MRACQDANIKGIKIKVEKVRLGNAMRKCMVIESNKYTEIPPLGKTLKFSDLRSAFYRATVPSQPSPLVTREALIHCAHIIHVIKKSGRGVIKALLKLPEEGILK